MFSFNLNLPLLVCFILCYQLLKIGISLVAAQRDLGLIFCSLEVSRTAQSERVLLFVDVIFVMTQHIF